MTANRLFAALTSPFAIGAAFGVVSTAFILKRKVQAESNYELKEDLSGRTYIVTGTTQGIGKVTAEELAKRNARVIMACRNGRKCATVAREITARTRNTEVHCRQCDLFNFDSIVSFVSELSKGEFALDRIDGVVHNAAVMEKEMRVNEDGIESTLATNHLGPFLMTRLMLEKLQKQQNFVRIVFLNTSMIQDKTLDFAKLDKNVDSEDWARCKSGAGFMAHYHSKLAEAMFARELSEKLRDSNISVTLADPDFVMTNLFTHVEDFAPIINLAFKIMSFFGTMDMAIQPVLYAIADPAMEGKTGVFINRKRMEQEWGACAEDEEARRKLWDVSEKLTRYSDRLAELKRELARGREEKREMYEDRDARKAFETTSNITW